MPLIMYLERLKLISENSEHSTKKVSAIIEYKNAIIAQGFNVLHPPCHAEEMAINNLDKVPYGCKMYLYGLLPCEKCAKLIVKSEIHSLYIWTIYDHGKWLKSCEKGFELLQKHDVYVEIY